MSPDKPYPEGANPLLASAMLITLNRNLVIMSGLITDGELGVEPRLKTDIGPIMAENSIPVLLCIRCGDSAVICRDDLSLMPLALNAALEHMVQEHKIEFMAEVDQCLSNISPALS